MHTQPDDAKGLRYWSALAPRYDRTMTLLGRPMPAMCARVTEAVAGASSALEVGAGTGLVTAAIARAASRVVATDYAPPMVEALRQRVQAMGLVNVTCEVADIYALPHPDASFDVVVAANVLHLVPDLDGALASLRRVLKPGGLLVAPTFCHDQNPLAWLTSRAMALFSFPGRRRFSLKTLRAALASAGFAPRRAEVIPGLLPIGYVDAHPQP